MKELPTLATYIGCEFEVVEQLIRTRLEHWEKVLEDDKILEHRSNWFQVRYVAKIEELKEILGEK